MPPPHRRPPRRAAPHGARRPARSRPSWWTRALESVSETLGLVDGLGLPDLYDDSGPPPRATAPLRTEPPRRPVAAPGEWRCPRTGGRLEPVEVAGFHVHVNQTCGGLMVEADSERRLLDDRARWPEVEAFCAALEEAASRKVDGRALVYIDCPGCSGPMHRKNFGKVSGVLVDTCPRCGTWFDAGELPAALAFLAGDGEARRARFEEAERAYAQEQRRRMRRIEARTPHTYGGSFADDFYFE